ncbi:hypothetical protein DL771_010532 [Monosporascus sp. 5C6A]|nr:hypothetical protein DL771_010532 [Monosporascus sp. 5C6A]
MADRSKKRRGVPDLIEEDGSQKRQATGTQLTPLYDHSNIYHGSSCLAAHSSFVGQGIQHSGTGPFQVHGNLNIGALHSEIPTQCLADLYSTDPRYDKNRIEQTKGGLLRDSYRWILDHHDFIRWRDDPESRLLWIKGDPGKGKTMLLCGIIDELKEQIANITYLLSFFFCQATDDRLNNATAVLRGLIYLLADQQPFLVSHIQNKYNHAGKTLFEGVNAWFALREIFINILQDPGLPNITFIVDALDECETDLSQLLDLIMKVSPRSRIKWLLSSRNRIDIEQKLRPDHSRTRLSLELKSNADHVSHAVDAYIDHCISEIPAIRDNLQLQTQVRDQMRRKADGTFLWVGLVAQELKDDPGLPTDQITPPDPDLLTAARYSCIHWVDHLAECKPDEQAQYEDLRDGGIIDRFLRRHYLHWLEALSILGGVSEGILAMSKLNGLFQPAVEHNWSACLSTLEGHGGSVSSVAFSPDGSRLASGSNDRTVKVWDAATGACLSTLKSHSGPVDSVAFSPDGNYLITNAGTIPLPASSKNNLLPTAPQQFPNDYFNLGIKNEWITYNGRNLLWLLPDYRPGCSAVTARAIAVGCGPGRVVIAPEMGKKRTAEDRRRYAEENGFNDDARDVDDKPVPREVLDYTKERYGFQMEMWFEYQKTHPETTPYELKTLKHFAEFIGRFVKGYIKGPLKQKIRLSTARRPKTYLTLENYMYMERQLWQSDWHEYVHEAYRVFISAKLKCHVFTPARLGEISEGSTRKGTGKGLRYKVSVTVKFRSFS